MIRLMFPRAIRMRVPIFLAAMLLSAGCLYAEGDCDPSKPSSACSVGSIYDYSYENCNVDIVVTKSARSVADTNSATATPDAFASNTHASFQNFLNLFDFGIDDVTEAEDGRSLLVRFNPLKRGRSKLGLTLTVSKPEVSSLVQNAIPEAGRTDTVEKLTKTIDDLDDFTLGLSYTRNSATCTKKDLKNGRCWGRSAQTYKELLSPILIGFAPKLEKVDDLTLAGELRDLLKSEGLPTADMFDTQLPSGASSRAVLVGKIKSIACRDRKITKEHGKIYSESGIQHLAALVDNQPQLTGTLSFRDPGQYGGPETWNFLFELQFGRANLNRLFGGDRDPFEALKTLDEKELSSAKFVLMLSYQRTDDFVLDELSLPDANGELKPVADFTAINDDGASNLGFKFQWGRDVGAKIAGRQARFDVSLDGIWSDDEEKRNKKRWIGTVTYTVPLGDQMSLPISVNYADKPEFLGDQEKSLGTHFGISYRLPWDGRKESSADDKI